jgi:hypothetical protein
LDRLPQNMRTIRAHEGRYLDAVNHGIRACLGLGFGPDRIDAGIGAATLREFLDALLNIFLHEIQSDGA